MDEDFFKDYPPVNGDDISNPVDTDIPTETTSNEPILLGDPIGLGDPIQEEEEETSETTTGLNGMGGYGAPPDENAEPECEAVMQWRIDFAKRLEDKMDNERRVKAERAEQARQTLDNMYGKWKQSKEIAEEENQKKEKEMKMQRDGVIARMSKAGEKPNWDIIPELVDMTGKFKEGARDTSRMRQVLLRMKTN